MTQWNRRPQYPKSQHQKSSLVGRTTTLGLALLLLSSLATTSGQARSSGKTAKASELSASTRTTPALWRVKAGRTARSTTGKQGKQQYVYLFGSIHIGNKTMYPLPYYVRNSFYDSRYLAVELDTRKITPAIQRTIRKNTMLARGDSLKKWLRPASYNRLQSYAKANKLKGYSRKQPWFVASHISLNRAAKLGFSPAKGVDVHLLGLAKQTKKPVLALESWQEQLGVFGKMTRQEQDSYLQETLKSHSVARTNDPTLKLMWAWQGGHENELWSQVSKEMARINNPRFMKRMLYDRNDRMVKAIKPWLKLPYSTFVVVGSAHMLGQNGILRQLHNQGLQVERVHPRTGKWNPYYPNSKWFKKAKAHARLGW